MLTHTPTIAPVECQTLPDEPSSNVYYRLVPVRQDLSYYRERTDRNIGWITRDEQAQLSRSMIGIAGCGGMGGLLASIFVRLGVGEIRIADSETFDVSNINRQFAARRDTVGKSKAFETALATRAVSDDMTLAVYPQGIQENTVASFLAGCDVVCDEIEFWAIGARILLHREARKRGITVFNCNTVGFGTRLFCFEPEGYTMESTLGFSYEEAKILQNRISSKEAAPQEIRIIMEAVLEGLVPEIPEYGKDTSAYSTERAVYERLFMEHKAMIISTNPVMATGFLADHILFHLLKKSPIERNLAKPVPAPGYLYFDAGFHTAKRVERKEVIHER
jgi:molybdopterin/thiamine biosynthesis adenylyltransferase